MKKVLYGVLILLGLIVAGGCIYLNSVLPIITGYAAKNLCSNIFISGRDPASIEAVDLNFSFIKYTRNKVDYEKKSVLSSFLWGKARAIYREGFGATLVKDIPEESLRNAVFPPDTDPGYMPDSTLWPLGDLMPDIDSTGIDKAALAGITENFIVNHSYNGNPFAFLVLHKGVTLAEAYKPQFDKNTRFLSWSMAKSFLNGIVGVLVREGRIDVNKPVKIDEWQNDERSLITLNELMQMQSGLEWNEDYGSRSDVNLMLFNEGDMSRYAISRPLEYPAGTSWKYSSGTANIISSLIRKEFESDTSCYAFLQDKFFEKIGITNAVFEVDPSGDFVGSSYLYATARDYARFALLYLNDGIFNSERILPEGWVDYTTTPASASGGVYGSLFWLNESGKFPSAPEDMYMCTGHDGQQIFILPSNDLIVVVLGYSPKPGNEIDFDRLLNDILGIF